MHTPTFDPNEDRSNELSSNDVTELEATLRSFQPRPPIEQVAQLPSAAPTQSRHANPWTLGATWISGAIVGGLVVFLFGLTQAEPQPSAGQSMVTTQQVINDIQPELPTAQPETQVVFRSETIDRLFSEAWLESNCLSASSHLAFQSTPKPKTVREITSIERELRPEANRPSTQQQLLRELLSDPDSVL